MKKIALILFCCFLSVHISAQEFDLEWAFNLDVRVFDIATDSKGNIAVIGTYWGDIDIDPGLDTFQLSAIYEADIFIAKMDPIGNLIWAHSFGGVKLDFVNNVTIDADDNVILIGTFEDTVDFDPGVGEDIHVSGHFHNAFVLKLDSDGNYLWCKSFGSNYKDGLNKYDTQARALVLDQTGNVYVSGSFVHEVDFDPGNGEFKLKSKGEYDGYILKLSSIGEFVWCQHLEPSGSRQDRSYAVAQGLKITKAGKLVVIGNFSESLSYNQQTSVAGLTASDAGPFVLNYTLDGTLEWAKTYGAEVKTLEVDQSGNIYLFGNFHVPVDLDPGPATHYLSHENTDVYILKWNNLGEFVWAKSFTGRGNLEVRAVEMDAWNGLYITGNYNHYADFDPDLEEPFNPHSKILESSSGVTPDVFIVKLDTGGHYLWAGSLGNDFNDDRAWAIHVDDYGNVISTGDFRNTADVDPGPEVKELTSYSNQDSYVLKLSQLRLETKEIALMSGAKVFPNPTSQNLTIQLEQIQRKIQLLIQDIKGCSLSQKTYYDQDRIETSIEGPPGIYFVKIQTEEGVWVEKVVKY